MLLMLRNLRIVDSQIPQNLWNGFQTLFAQYHAGKRSPTQVGDHSRKGGIGNLRLAALNNHKIDVLQIFQQDLV